MKIDTETTDGRLKYLFGGRRSQNNEEGLDVVIQEPSFYWDRNTKLVLR